MLLSKEQFSFAEDDFLCRCELMLLERNVNVYFLISWPELAFLWPQKSLQKKAAHTQLSEEKEILLYAVKRHVQGWNIWLLSGENR